MKDKKPKLTPEQKQLVKFGVSMKRVAEMEKAYEALSQSDLIMKTARNSLIKYNIFMDLILQHFQKWGDTNSTGLGRLILSVTSMVHEGHDDFDRACMLAERAMKIMNPLGDQSIPQPIEQKEHPLDSVMYEFGLRRMPAGHGTKADLNGNGAAQ